MARKSKYDLRSQLNEMLDEIALSENKRIDLSRKLERQKARLQKFGKQTGDVQLELEQIASMIPQLNEHIEALKDAKLREEALRRRDALLLRQTALSERAQEYRPEVRAQILEMITNLNLEI